MPTLVVGFDGSADAQLALAWARALAKSVPGTQIHLAHALDLPAVSIPGGEETIAQLLEKHEQMMTKRLAEIGAELEAEEISAAVHIRRWFGAETILEYAKAVGAELIAVGTRGVGRARRMMLGSTSSEVVRSAEVPVLVARGARMPAPPKRVLVAVDGSAQSIKALRVAHRWCPKADLVAIRVREGAGTLDAEGLTEAIRAAGLTPETCRSQMLEGNVAATLLRLAEEEAYDLIFMGSRGLGPLQELLLGSVSEKVMNLAPCPVVIVR